MAPATPTLLVVDALPDSAPAIGVDTDAAELMVETPEEVEFGAARATKVFRSGAAFQSEGRGAPGVSMEGFMDIISLEYLVSIWMS